VGVRGDALADHVLRPAACLGILLGGWIHFGVDLLRNALGMGAISLLYPFSREMVELGGLYYSEDTLRYAPAALGVIAIIEGWAWWQRRRGRVEDWRDRRKAIGSSPPSSNRT
jgi:membrane-bound metal-dependent hydrolase YbcI (DUF457 family)